MARVNIHQLFCNNVKETKQRRKNINHTSGKILTKLGLKNKFYRRLNIQKDKSELYERKHIVMTQNVIFKLNDHLYVLRP